MKVEVILRTHDVSNVHTDWRERFFKGTKADLILGCMKSLITSCKAAMQFHDIEIVVLDDHSSQGTKNEMALMLKRSGIKHSLVELQAPGYNYSAHEQFMRCRDSTADLVYSVEDDYLHEPSAIMEMIESYRKFKIKMPDQTIVLYPFDAPEEYDPPKYPAFVVHGSRRHWRSGIYTTNVMMTEPKLFKDHWELFERLALKYNGNYLEPRTEHVEESNTIWTIWGEGKAVRFNPIPSLALHMQFDQQIDPFIDWQQWWVEYAK